MRALLTMIAAGAVMYAQADAPKRTLVDGSQVKKKAGQAEPVSARDPGSSAFDALISSTENLNAIRDSNVRRLGEGCSPEAAARIGELRTRLGIKSGPEKKDATTETAMLALASGWLRPVPENPPVVPPRKIDSIDAVLPGSEKTAKNDEVQLQAELNKLLASCGGAKR